VPLQAGVPAVVRVLGSGAGAVVAPALNFLSALSVDTSNIQALMEVPVQRVGCAACAACGVGYLYTCGVCGVCSVWCGVPVQRVGCAACAACGVGYVCGYMWGVGGYCVEYPCPPLPLSIPCQSLSTAAAHAPFLPVPSSSPPPPRPRELPPVSLTVALLPLQHVPTVMEALQPRLEDAIVVKWVVTMLRNLAVLPANRQLLLPTVATVLSALERHADTVAFVRHGVVFLCAVTEVPGAGNYPPLPSDLPSHNARALPAPNILRRPLNTDSHTPVAYNVPASRVRSLPSHPLSSAHHSFPRAPLHPRTINVPPSHMHPHVHA
jgi:hypothetical protein